MAFALESVERAGVFRPGLTRHVPPMVRNSLPFHCLWVGPQLPLGTSAGTNIGNPRNCFPRELRALKMRVVSSEAQPAATSPAAALAPCLFPP